MILLMREHNRVAKVLATLNPHWEDETLFQEARRILIAEIQHITYDEFLKTILDGVQYKNAGLEIDPSGYFTGYDSKVDPGIENSVAIGVVGFLGTTFPPTPVDQATSTKEVNKFENSDLDSLLSGLLVSSTPTLSSAFGSEEASRDLWAYMVQQERDHGLPGYAKYRERCGLGTSKNFSDLADDISSAGIASLEELYGSPNDVDLVAGGLMEGPAHGGLLGRTFSCLLGEQLKRVRLGDRFWYENDFPPNQFSKEQLAEIKKVTLASLLCVNSGLERVQSQVFLVPDPFLNAPVMCKTIRRMSLEPWREVGPRELIVPPRLLDLSVEKAKESLKKRQDMEKLVFERGRVVSPDSAIWKASGFQQPNDAALRVANTSIVLEFVTQELTNLFLLKSPNRTASLRLKRQALFLPRGPELNAVFVGDRLPQPPPSFCPDGEETRPCDPKSPFRTFSGWCNNLAAPHFGKELTLFDRLLAPKYEDGISTPRLRSVLGGPLPSPRVISTFVHPDVSHPNQRYSLVFMQFGQFLDHDVTMTPVHRGFQKSVLDCRSCDSSHQVHPECFPIPVPPGDPFFPPMDFGRPRCISFVRSLPGQTKLG
ncbi:unnamed protein product [Darwinula stevensoni]|uniref:Uncharacterized protein n=1 Tax=Darwinula stevensoni TaxID=69355 RepID=A0A7R9AH21_9CRUS|nr:unnamed protein product [Darwinula stevensoni]CAG0905142.1 unnamed protein product [Darwinula stevensoni]